MRRIRTLHPRVQAMPGDIPDWKNSKNPHMLAFQLLNLEGREDRFKYNPYIRCSSLHNVCVREQLLGFRSNKSNIKRSNINLTTTFDIGHSIHEFFQNHPKYFSDKRLGWWECQACKAKYFGKFRKQKCEYCGAAHEAFRYLEHRVKLEDPYRVSGHPDMFLTPSHGEVVVGEFKTITADAWKKLKEPLGDHRVQMNAYMHLLQYDKTLPITVSSEYAIAIYISKGHIAKEIPYKAFVIKRDQSVVNYVKRVLLSYKYGFENPEWLPRPRPSCLSSNWTHSDARNCPVLDVCKTMPVEPAYPLDILEGL